MTTHVCVCACVHVWVTTRAVCVDGRYSIGLKAHIHIVCVCGTWLGTTVKSSGRYGILIPYH